MRITKKKYDYDYMTAYILRVGKNVYSLGVPRDIFRFDQYQIFINRKMIVGSW